MFAKPLPIQTIWFLTDNDDCKWWLKCSNYQFVIQIQSMMNLGQHFELRFTCRSKVGMNGHLKQCDIIYLIYAVGLTLPGVRVMTKWRARWRTRLNRSPIITWCHTHGIDGQLHCKNLFRNLHEIPQLDISVLITHFFFLLQS